MSPSSPSAPAAAALQASVELIVRCPPWVFTALSEAGAWTLTVTDDVVADALEITPAQLRKRMAQMAKDDPEFIPRAHDGGSWLTQDQAMLVLMATGGTAAMRAYKTLQGAFQAGQAAVDAWQATMRPAAPAKGYQPKPGSEEEEKRILEALDKHRWNVQAVGRELGYARRTLYRRMREFGIER